MPQDQAPAGNTRSVLFARAFARAKQICRDHTPGTEAASKGVPDHVERQETLIDENQALLASWGIDCYKLKLGLALTDFAKATPDVTFASLLAFKARQTETLPDTAVKLAMNPVGIDLVEVIQEFKKFFEDEIETSRPKTLLKQFCGLANVLLHAEAGRLMVADTVEILAQTEADLLGESGPNSPTKREAYRLAAEVADQITGHDSFRAGFGKEVIPPALTAMLRQLVALAKDRAPGQETTLILDQDFAAKIELVELGLKAPDLYPASRSVEGFILQILDRLDATEADTQLRYVREGMAYQGKSITAAITGGIHSNLVGLEKIHAQLLLDIEVSGLSELNKQRLVTSPFMVLFERGLKILAHTLSLFTGPDSTTDLYWLQTESGRTVQVYELEVLETEYPAAFERLASEILRPV